MEEPIRILHLEDEPNDSELVKLALDSQGVACRVEVVATRDAFAAALDRGGIDLILSDYTLPVFDGLTALRLAQEKVPEVPFIFVSGTIGEESAIESLRNGATDYVLKHRLSRLGPAVTRAVGEAAERTRRMQAESGLQHEQQFLKAMLDSLAEGIVACNSDGVLTLLNRAAQEFHGLPEIPIPADQWAEHYGLYLPDGNTPMKRESVPLFRALQGERPTNVEMVIRPRTGPTRTVLTSGTAITDPGGRKLGAVIAMHDITDHKHLEEQLRQTQKMEAIGRLASGVAHDFNNFLTVIMGHGQLLKRRLEPDDPGRQDTDEIQRAAERAASLTRQLLAFCRQQALQPRPLDLNEAIAEVGKMLKRLIGADIDLLIAPGSKLGRVMVDPGQIEQLILNLAVNARDAMPEGGKLTIETAEVKLAASTVCEDLDLRPGAYAMLAVSDTGCGMDSETKSRIFDPFFTTKEIGKGTGLGLSTVHGIVKQSGGHIEVYSEVGRGTTFKVYLPLTHESPAAVDPVKSPVAPSTGSETILVVDDENPVRSIISRTLQLSGYTVMVVGTGEEALGICEGAGPPDLVITDVIMPKMSGHDLAERLSAVHPEMQILFMSGYTENAIVHHGVLAPETAYLPKPFGPDALLKKVREVLDKRPAKAA